MPIYILEAEIILGVLYRKGWEKQKLVLWILLTIKDTVIAFSCCDPAGEAEESKPAPGPKVKKESPGESLAREVSGRPGGPPKKSQKRVSRRLCESKFTSLTTHTPLIKGVEVHPLN